MRWVATVTAKTPDPGYKPGMNTKKIQLGNIWSRRILARARQSRRSRLLLRHSLGVVLEVLALIAVPRALAPHLLLIAILSHHLVPGEECHDSNNDDDDDDDDEEEADSQ